jgi:hypothetical protein
MQVQHPRATDIDGRPAPSKVSIPGHGNVPVDEDGYLDNLGEDGARRAMNALAEAYGVEYTDDGDVVLGDEPETCDVVKSDGEVCGRELPCPYHSDDQED